MPVSPLFQLILEFQLISPFYLKNAYFSHLPGTNKIVPGHFLKAYDPLLLNPKGFCVLKICSKSMVSLGV